MGCSSELVVVAEFFLNIGAALNRRGAGHGKKKSPPRVGVLFCGLVGVGLLQASVAVTQTPT